MGENILSRRVRMKWVVVCLLMVVVACQNTTAPCTFTSNGHTYDLSALTYDPSQSSPDGYSTMDQSEHTYFINFCQQVSTVDSSTIGCNNLGPTAVCLVSGPVKASCGVVANQVFSASWNDTLAPAHEGNFTSGISVS